jgi:hypothetical protein
MVVADQHGEAAGTGEYGSLSEDARKRDLQLEAKAHIIVQKWIDGGGLNGHALSGDGNCEANRPSCELLLEHLLEVEHHMRPTVYSNKMRKLHASSGRQANSHSCSDSTPARR